MSKPKANKPVETSVMPVEPTTIRLKNYQIFDSLNAAHQLIRVPLSFGTKLKLRRLIRVLEVAIKDVQAEQEILVDAHAKKDEKGDVLRDANHQIQFKDSYRKPNEDLMNTDNEITVTPLNASDFGKPEDLDDKQMGLSLLALGDLLVDDITC